MGSVQDVTDCESCNYKYAFSDYYYKSGEFYILCSRCGFYHSCLIVNRDERDVDDWIPKYEEKKIINAHAFVLGGDADGVKSCGGLKKEELEVFLKDVRENENIKYATYTFELDGVWYEKDVMKDEQKIFVGVYEEQYSKGDD